MKGAEPMKRTFRVTQVITVCIDETDLKGIYPFHTDEYKNSDKMSLEDYVAAKTESMFADETIVEEAVSSIGNGN